MSTKTVQKSTFEALHEDEDDWLQSYLATTEYGSDTKLTSQPVRPKNPKKEEKKEKEKKFYKLQSAIKGSGNLRRKSWAPQSSNKILPRVESLPERVNAIRTTEESADLAPPAGHFVREHRKSKEHPAEEFITEGSRKVAKSCQRRQSLEYDSLDAVKTRVMQAAQLWEQKEIDGEDSEEQRDDLIPASSLMSAPEEDKKPEVEKKLPGRSWLMRRWPGKLTA